MISRPVPPPAAGDEMDVDATVDVLAWGTLPRPERRVLAEILATETSAADRCWFCVWEGFGADDHGVHGRVRLPARNYLLYSGPIDRVVDSATGLDQSPNLWWPDDRAWFVATEIDYAWTYVAGSRRAIDRVLGDDRLEALAAELTHKPFHDSDVVNAALDGG
jgi:hypothetical protein